MGNATRTKKALALSAVIAASAMGLAGCATTPGGSADGCDETYRIGFSHPTGEIVAIQTVKKFAALRGEELDCVEVLLDATTGGNLQSQRDTIESWVTQGVDAIVIFPVEASAFASVQKQAQDQGIKWLTYSADMEGQDGSTGFDNVLSGTLLADDVEEWLAETHPNGDVSAIVTSYSPIATLYGRAEVPIERLNELGIPIVVQQDCVDATCGLQITEDALRENPNLRVFIGMNDDAAIGAVKAFANAGIDPAEVYVAGQDGSEEALVAILEETYYKASAAIMLSGLGASVVDNSLAAITGQGDPNAQTPTVLASYRDLALVRELLTQYK